MKRLKTYRAAIGSTMLIIALVIGAFAVHGFGDGEKPTKAGAAVGSTWPKNIQIDKFIVVADSEKRHREIGFLYKEIFKEKRYFFRSQTETPFIVDCGSHIGLSLLYFKSIYPKAQILAFEPDPDNFSLLALNVEQNRLGDVRLENKAVSDKETKLRFYSGGSMVSSLFPERGGKHAHSVEVSAVRLSQYIERPVDYLKLDVEGAEKMVLEDLSAANKLQRIGQMFVEYHHHIAKTEDALSDFLGILERHGFGYQMESATRLPYEAMVYQDIHIYAYNKSLSQGSR